MPIITTIAEVKANGVKVRNINSDSSIADMELAAQLYLVPVLGSALYAQLLLEYASPTTATAINALLQKAQRAVVPLAYWLDLANIHAQISESGVVTVLSEKQQPAHRWEFEQIRENLSVKGCFALELMIQFLYDNATALSWQPAYAFTSIFKTGLEFNQYFPLFQPYRTFENLRAIVKQCEDQYIRNAIGSDYFDELIDLAVPTPEEAKVILYIKKAVANLAIKTAIETLSVQFSSQGFTVMLSRNPDLTVQGKENAPGDQLSLMLNSAERTGINYIREMKNYMNGVASATVLADYYNSALYVSPADQAAKPNPNDNRTGLYAF